MASHCSLFEHRVLPKTTAAATGRDLPMVDSRSIERHDPSIIYTCYYHNFRASALAVWHLTLTSTYRTAHAVMVWRSMPHAPDALSKAGTARAQHRPHVLTAPVLCGHKISRGCWSAQAARIIDWSDEGRRGGDHAHAQRGVVSRCSGLMPGEAEGDGP